MTNLFGGIKKKKILEFLEKLEEKEINYKLNKARDAMMVEIAIPANGGK